MKSYSTKAALARRIALPVLLLAFGHCSLRAQSVETADSIEVLEAATTRFELDTARVSPRLSRYERHRQRALRRWMRMIPNQASLHFAGGVGLLSAGFGWHYGRSDKWETELLFGFLPAYRSEHVKMTFTLKERYVPWHCRLGSRWSIEPLATGLFFNTISGDEFWQRLPDKYPKKYYGFSTKIRSHIFLGQRIRYDIPKSRRRLHQAISAYYEISACDLNIITKATNREYPWRETLSLSFGLRWEM